jgi:putative sugar O-methyltransferase
MGVFSSKTSRLIEALLWSALWRLFGMRKGQFYRMIGKGKLAPEQEQLLALMRQDNAVSGAPFRASEHWIRVNEAFDDWFQVEGIRDVESQTLNQTFASPPPDRFNVLRHASWMLYQKVKSRDRLGLLGKISATVKQGSGLGFVFDGNYVSWDLLVSIDTLCSIGEVDDSLWHKPLVVVDLGAGWGRVGYVLKSVNPNCVYVACDLPEALLVLSTYLPRLLPGERVHTYQENREIVEFSRELLIHGGGCRFCGTQDLARFADKSIDIFINIASFKEISIEQVRR